MQHTLTIAYTGRVDHLFKEKKMKKTLIVLPILVTCIAASGYAAHSVSHHHYHHKTPVVSAHADMLDINQATAEDFAKLKGIGDKKAQAIVDYRETHGPFASVDKLTEVKGIGKAMLERILSQNPDKLTAIMK